MVTKNSGGTTTESVTYTYDTQNRRISETATGTTNLTEQYAYDGGSLLAVINPSVDQVTEQYFDGPNADGQTQALAEETLSGNGSTGVKWMLTDNVGSVKDVVDNGTGHAVLDQIKYDSFGNVLTQTNSSNDTQMSCTGYVQDAATGLDYANARYYQPTTGRFISQDPSGFWVGGHQLVPVCGESSDVCHRSHGPLCRQRLWGFGELCDLRNGRRRVVGRMLFITRRLGVEGDGSICEAIGGSGDGDGAGIRGGAEEGGALAEVGADVIGLEGAVVVGSAVVDGGDGGGAGEGEVNFRIGGGDEVSVGIGNISLEGGDVIEVVGEKGEAGVGGEGDFGSGSGGMEFIGGDDFAIIGADGFEGSGGSGPDAGGIVGGFGF